MARESFGPLLAACAGLLLLLASAGPAYAADRAGEVVIARGIATGQSPNAPGRILGAGSALFEGDLIATGPRSVALLKLDDGTRVTLRPDTKFQVEVFKTAGADAGAVYRLFQGGLRAVTGFLSKNNPNAVRLRTAVATIGIRGTEFDARLCDQECAKEAQAQSAPAGRAGFIKGNVIARASNGDRARALKVGAPVYNGDRVLSGAGSFAVLTFADGGRVTLMPDTEFAIEELSYEESKPDLGRAFFSLLRGGLRAVSGAIGHARPRGYQLRTAVATIGIRGTGFDLLSQGTGQSMSGNPSPGEDGLYVNVTAGEIVIDEQIPLPAGDKVYIGQRGLPPQIIPEMPGGAGFEQAPDMSSITSQTAAASGAVPTDGLIVGCYVGNCSVTAGDETVDLSNGQAAHVSPVGSAPTKLAETPPYIQQDPNFGAFEGGPSTSTINMTTGGGDFGCSVQ